jgi:hypothetical protein
MAIYARAAHELRLRFSASMVKPRLESRFAHELLRAAFLLLLASLNLPPLKACLSQNRSACPIAARIGKEAKDALIKAALRQNRTVANLVETIIREWLEKTGYLKRKH